MPAVVASAQADPSLTLSFLEDLSSTTSTHQGKQCVLGQSSQSFSVDETHSSTQLRDNTTTHTVKSKYHSHSHSVDDEHTGFSSLRNEPELSMMCSSALPFCGGVDDSTTVVAVVPEEEDRHDNDNQEDDDDDVLVRRHQEQERRQRPEPFVEEPEAQEQRLALTDTTPQAAFSSKENKKSPPPLVRSKKTITREVEEDNIPPPPMAHVTFASPSSAGVPSLVDNKSSKTRKTSKTKEPKLVEQLAITSTQDNNNIEVEQTLTPLSNRLIKRRLLARRTDSSSSDDPWLTLTPKHKKNQKRPWRLLKRRLTKKKKHPSSSGGATGSSLVVTCVRVLASKQDQQEEQQQEEPLQQEREKTNEIAEEELTLWDKLLLNPFWVFSTSNSTSNSEVQPRNDTIQKNQEPQRQGALTAQPKQYDDEISELGMTDFKGYQD